MGSFIECAIDLLYILQQLVNSIFSKFKKPKQKRPYNGLHDFQEEQLTDFDIQHQKEYSQSNKLISQKNIYQAASREDDFYEQRTRQYNAQQKQSSSNMQNNQKLMEESQQKINLNFESNTNSQTEQSNGQLQICSIIDQIKKDIKSLDLQDYQQLVNKTIQDIRNTFATELSVKKACKSEFDGIEICQFPAQKTFKYKIMYQLNCNFQQYCEVYTDVDLQMKIFQNTLNFKEILRKAPYFKKYFLQLKKFMILERRCFNYFKITRKNQIFGWSLCFSDQKEWKDVNGAIMGKILALNIFRPIEIENKQKIQVTTYFDADLKSSLRAQKIVQRGLNEVSKQIVRLKTYIDQNYGQ